MDYLYQNRSALHYLLLPFSWLYSLVGLLRHRFAKPKKLPCRVICVGGAVMGGAGKTPIVRALALYFKKHGYKPHIISRGYGRKKTGNFQVEAFHTAYDVGDEALMLSQDIPVWVADDRFTAGEMAIEAGCDLLLLDDGYQNPSLHKDVHILVSDANFGIGNGLVFPAGCLREPLSMAVKRADLHIILSSDGEEARHKKALKKLMKPVIFAELSPLPSAVKKLPTGHWPTGHWPTGHWIVFCGIARNYKFFSTAHKLASEMEDSSVHIVTYRGYDDHHFYSDKDKKELWRLAADYDASLITTEKDYMRFSESERKDLFVIGSEVSLDKALLDKFFELGKS